VKDCNGNILKEGDVVVWARITGGSSTLAIGEVLKALEASVKIRVIRTGAHFRGDGVEIGDYSRVNVSHRIMILPDKEMW